MATINMAAENKPLIKAAIRLANWMASLNDLNESALKNIQAIQQLLTKLPKINDGTLAMFGFSVEHGDMSEGLVRGWDVSIEYFSNDAERQGGVEIFSSYIPIPETNDQQILQQKKNNEVYFHWPVAESASLITPKQQQKWIEDVSHPEQFIQSGDRLRLEIVFQDDYAEIECVIKT
jgi:hypothetical protein